MKNNVNTTDNASNKEQSKPLKQGVVRCSTCGRFMGRIGLIARVRLEVECGMIRTHLCKKEEITYATCEYVHH